MKKVPYKKFMDRHIITLESLRVRVDLWYDKKISNVEAAETAIKLIREKTYGK